MREGDEQTTRQRLFKHVEKYPGLHQRELARALNLRPSHVEHHLRGLTRAGLLLAKKEGGYSRYFVTSASPDATAVPGRNDARVLPLLRQATPLKIIAALLVEGPLLSGQLAERVGISPGTLTYQLDKLEAGGLVKRIASGSQRTIHLENEADIRRILLAYEPPDDLVAGFQDLWDDVGL